MCVIVVPSLVDSCTPTLVPKSVGLLYASNAMEHRSQTTPRVRVWTVPLLLSVPSFDEINRSKTVEKVGSNSLSEECNCTYIKTNCESMDVSNMRNSTESIREVSLALSFQKRMK